MNVAEKEAELLGALIGDGHISLASKSYVIGFTGNIISDKKYFDYLSTLIQEVWGKKCFPRIGGRGLRIVICSKKKYNFKNS